MGTGKGNIDINLILKVLALIFCAVAVGLTNGLSRVALVSNSSLYASGGFLIAVAIFLGWQFTQGEVDKTFSAYTMICGFVWNLGAAIGVILWYFDYSRSSDILCLVSGCLSLAVGIVMLIDGLHGLGVI